MTYPNLTEPLQTRLLAEANRLSLRQIPDSDNRRRIEDLEAHIAVLEDALANTEALGEQQRQEAGKAAQQVQALEAHIVTLEGAIAKAQALSEQQRQEAETAARQVEALQAHLATLVNFDANADLNETRSQKAEAAAKRVAVLEAHIAQVAIGIKLAILMGEGHATGFDLERLRRLADTVVA